jgi:uncharacterized DUF497 family protein
MIEKFEFEWDSAKAIANLRKHRVPFLKACEVFKDPLRLERLDDNEEYDEERWVTVGRVDEIVLAVVFTMRVSKIRSISARRATHDEQTEYWAGHVPF